MYSVKIEADPLRIMSIPFYGILYEPYLIKVCREDRTPVAELEVGNFVTRYLKFSAEHVNPIFLCLKENVEFEEAMQVVEEFCCLKGRTNVRCSFANL